MCALQPFSFSDITVPITLCVSGEHSEYDYTHHGLQMRSVRRDEADLTLDYICSPWFSNANRKKLDLNCVPFSINVLLNFFGKGLFKHHDSSYHANNNRYEKVNVYHGLK